MKENICICGNEKNSQMEFCRECLNGRIKQNYTNEKGEEVFGQITELNEIDYILCDNGELHNIAEKKDWAEEQLELI